MKRLEKQALTEVKRELRNRGLRTHKDVFTEYLKNSDTAYNHILGRLVREDWNDWLDRVGLARCSLTGLYGEYGYEVHFHGERSEAAFADHPTLEMMDLVEVTEGWDVEYVKDNGSVILRLYADGKHLYDFCDTIMATKEERVTAYIESKVN